MPPVAPWGQSLIGAKPFNTTPPQRPRSLASTLPATSAAAVKIIGCSAVPAALSLAPRSITRNSDCDPPLNTEPGAISSTPEPTRSAPPVISRTMSLPMRSPSGFKTPPLRAATSSLKMGRPPKARLAVRPESVIALFRRSGITDASVFPAPVPPPPPVPSPVSPPLPPSPPPLPEPPGTLTTITPGDTLSEEPPHAASNTPKTTASIHGRIRSLSIINLA